MARLADAFVRIRPDSTGFSAEARAQIKAATAGLTADVKATLNTDPVKVKVAELRAKMIELGSTAARLRATLDDKDAIARIAALQVRLLGLDRRITSPKLTLEGGDRVEAQLLGIDATLDRLNKKFNAGPVGPVGLVEKLARVVTGGGIKGGVTNPGPAGLGQLTSGLPGALSNPYVAGAAGVAGLASLPFIAQAAAGAVTFGLGAALAGIGVYAEKGVRSVQYQFSQLVSGKNGIQATLKNISPAFGQALTTILSAARTFLPQFIRAFGPALNAIAGPFKAFGTEIAGTLASPQVATALKDVGKAFGGILSALTPAIPGIVTAIADGIDNIAKAIARNPKAFADFLTFLGHVVGVALDVIAWLTNVADYLEMHFIPAFHDVVRFLDSWRHDIAKTMLGWYHDVTGFFDAAKRDTASAWDTMWRNTVSRLASGIKEAGGIISGWVKNISGWIADIVGLFSGLPHRAVNVLSGWGTALKNFAANAMNMMLTGFESVWHSVEGFFSGLPSRILHALGIHSPPDWAISAGKHVMGGLLKGLAHGGDVKSFFLGLVNDVTGPLASIWKLITGGGGVGSAMPGIVSAARWVMQHGGSRAAAAGVGGVVAGESGGNPEAVQQGVAVPGMGLIQWTPGSSAGPIQPIVTGNPVRDMAAQLIDMGAYIAARGGMEVLNAAGQVSPMAAAWAFSTMEAPLVPGSDIRPSVVQSLYAQGYDKGGWLKPGYTLAFNGTGQAEMITTAAKIDELIGAVQDGAEETAALGGQLDTLIGVTAGQGGDFADALNGGARGAGYAKMYRTRP